jgi:hypothetical protein
MITRYNEIKFVLSEIPTYFLPTYNVMYISNNFDTFIPIIQNEFNTILNISPLKPMSMDFLGNKRIRQITQPVVEKVSVSPFNIKTLYFTPKITVFKDLNEAFRKSSNN